jgi:hypothetical protein
VYLKPEIVASYQVSGAGLWRPTMRFVAECTRSKQRERVSRQVHWALATPRHGRKRPHSIALGRTTRHDAAHTVPDGTGHRDDEALTYSFRTTGRRNLTWPHGARRHGHCADAALTFV